jgi:hypothetical protein
MEMTDSQGMLEVLSRQLGSGGIDQIASQLGIGREATEKAVAGALPMLLGGLAKNTRGGGADALLGALQRDHDGTILDDVSGFLGQGSGAADAGMGVLKHVFGGRESAVESAIGKSAGIDGGQMKQILAMLAPLVMGMLGKSQRQGGLDASGLAGLLGGERKAAEQRVPGAADLIGSLLDSDGDGDMSDDIAKLGGSLLGGLFGGK